MANIGFVSTGLGTYWGQFPGLLDHLTAYSKQISDHLRSSGKDVAIIDAGLVDSAQSATSASEILASSRLELLFIYVSTYTLSSTVLPLAQGAGCPCILLNIQPDARIDYKALNALPDRGDRTGLWLEYCQACSIPEIAGVFNRSGISYEIVSGHLKDDAIWKQLGEWVQAACVRNGMRSTTLGILGHYYCGMLDVYTDLMKQSSIFGTRIELLEMDELRELRNSVSEEEISAKTAQFHREFEVSGECDGAEVRRAALTAVAIDKLVSRHGLGAMAYYYEGTSRSGSYWKKRARVTPRAE